MEAEVWGVPLLVDRVPVEDRGSVLYHPPHDRMVGRYSTLDPGFEGGLQSPEQILDSLYSSLGATIGGTFPNGAMLIHCLVEPRIKGRSRSTTATERLLGHCCDRALLIGFINQFCNAGLLDECCQAGDGLLIVPFGITYSGEYGHARIQSAH